MVASISWWDRTADRRSLFPQPRRETRLARSLAGTAGNPAAVAPRFGSASANGSGQRAKFHCGSGYWSQDSFVQVLATPEVPSQNLGSLAGRQNKRLGVAPGARELYVAAAGQMKVVK